MTTTSDAQQLQQKRNNSCYVYAKMKWMKGFQAFDLEGFFVRRKIYASLVENSEENQRKLQQLANDNNSAGFQFQLRQPETDKVLFQTGIPA